MSYRSDFIKENFEDIFDAEFNHGPIACVSLEKNSYKVQVKNFSKDMFDSESGWTLSEGKAYRHVGDDMMLKFITGTLRAYKIPVYGWRG